MAMLRASEPVPLYYQLELLLREQIESGRLHPGDPLPGEFLLADQFSVSRVTVRRALNRLEEDGLIVRRRGARTLISPNLAPQQRRQRDSSTFRGFEDELRRVGLHVDARILESADGAAPPRIAALLEIPAGEEVLRIRRLGSSHDMPLWLELRYFPLAIGRRLLDFDPASDSILVLLQRKLGLQIEQVQAQLQAVVASQRQAQLLSVEPGAPLFLHQSVTFACGQGPVQVVLAYLRGDCYRLDLQAVPRPQESGLELVGGGYLVDDRLLDLT